MNFFQTELRKKRRPVAIDLFAGAGGLTLGFEQAGFDVVAAAEIDPVHCAVHEFNFPHCTSICADASKLTGADIRKAAKLGKTTVDVVFGGAPCQGFSLIGKRALEDPRNGLLLDFVRLTSELNANYFVFENVKGITVGRHKQLLEELIETFQQNGYNVVLPYRVLNAADFGVPQDRQRLILMGARKGLPLPQYPERPHRARTNVWEAIGDLPDVNLYAELMDGDSLRNIVLGTQSRYVRTLRGAVADPANLAYPRQWDKRRLTSSMRTEHTQLSQDRFAATEHGKMEPISRFLKLDPNGVCNTLRAGTGSDRGAFTSPRPIHPLFPRCITVREAARLHSYPDWFRFHVTKWHGFRQIGNSVPPLLGRAVASQLVLAMNLHPEPPSTKLSFGSERLLSMTITDAARYYGVSNGVVGKRLRPLPLENPDQLTFAMA
jgi:DNA (cytosine-5)-methyltransferase 1